MLLFFDTETTGLPDFKAQSDAPHQPHIVQLAALLIDPVTRVERAVIDLIVSPHGWAIAPEIAAIHGITDEIAKQCGIPEYIAIRLFLQLRERAVVEIAHNISFDRRIIRIAALRHLGITREEIEVTEKKPAFCTMNTSTPIVNLPPTERMLQAGFTKPKPPKLSECIKYFFNEEHEGAHNALADVRACARVYFHLQDMKAAA